MLSTFNRNKSKLVIASLAAGFGVHLHTLAQAANDSGTLNINGQISNTTCVLDLGDGGSTSSGSKTLNLGTYTVAVAGAATGAGATFGTPATAIFSLKNANGTDCTFTNATRWDIGVNLATTQVFNTGTNVLLLSTGASPNKPGAASNSNTSQPTQDSTVQDRTGQDITMNVTSTGQPVGQRCGNRARVVATQRRTSNTTHQGQDTHQKTPTNPT